MASFRTRIRAVRFKSGGEVRVLPSRRDAVSTEMWNELQQASKLTWAQHEGNVVGFALVVWTADHDVSASVNNSELSQHPLSMLPSMIASSVQRVLTKVQINRALDRDDEDGTIA